MDVKMPRVNGFEVLKWLRSHRASSVIPVIIMSSSALDEDVLTAYRLGVNAYFQKPTNFSELQDILHSDSRDRFSVLPTAGPSSPGISIMV
jgi:two-component system response regulator